MICGRIAALAMLISAAAVASAGAQETVSISVPMAVSFEVTDVSRSTTGSPQPSTITFSNAAVIEGRGLRVSVQADAAAFTPPSGASIPASKVSWDILSATGGVGQDGTLGSSFFALVFQGDPASPPNNTSGRIDLRWTLAAPGSSIRAGAHQLTIRWKVESITP